MNASLQTQPDAVKTAILFTEWFEPQHTEAHLGVPSALLPLLGVPILQCVVERLVASGCTLIHVALGDDHLPVRALLSDGSRWGCRLVYHDAGESERFNQLMRRLNIDPDLRYTLASANHLPLTTDKPTLAPLSKDMQGRADFFTRDEVSQWSGWGVFSGSWLLTQNIDIRHGAIESHLLQNPLIEIREQPHTLSTTSLSALLESNRLMLSSNSTGSITEPGRGCVIHPNAKIMHPVCIGEHVKIGSGAIIGPNSVIGHGCFIDKDANLQNCVILPNSYIGEGLELNDVVVRHNLLANVRIGTLIKISDPNLISPLHISQRAEENSIRTEKLLAHTLCITLLPLHMLILLLNKCSPHAASRKPYGHISPDILCHFRDTFYPGLHKVIQGQLSLIGPTPRSNTEVNQIPLMWRVTYDKQRYGLLNEEQLQNPDTITPESKFASDAFAYANHDNVGTTISLLRGYLLRVVLSLGKRSIHGESTEQITQ